VGRTQELALLNSYLDRALAGEGQIVFVTGGRGGENRRCWLNSPAARRSAPRSDAAGGNGDNFAGVGDPYLPFREVMGQLTGDVAARELAVR
jgi:hypothetical protein